MEHDDFEVEAVPGLPEELPDGEYMLWQGAPDWKVLARRAFHLQLLGVYFLLLLVARAALELMSGAGILAALQTTLPLAILGLCAAGLFALYARLIAGSTLYTITNKRLVMRFGVALSMTINLPFSRIHSAAVKCSSDGYGDIPVTLEEGQKLSYIVMWPNVRPWHWKHPEPMLRAIPNALHVAEILADAASSVTAANPPAVQEQSARDRRNDDYELKQQGAIPAGDMA